MAIGLPRTKPVLEKKIEAAVVAYAKKKGFLCRKMNGLGFRSWPDRLFISPHGEYLWIEFKRPGESLTPLQAAFHMQLQERGIWVRVVHSVAGGKAILDE